MKTPAPQNLPTPEAAEAGRIIDLMGGTLACAAFFEVGASSVSDWRQTGIPRARLRHLRDVRPDVLKKARRAVRSAARADLARA